MKTQRRTIKLLSLFAVSCAAFDAALAAYRAKPGDRKEIDGVNNMLDILVRNRIVPASAKIK